MIRLCQEKDFDKVLTLLNQVAMVHHKARPDLFKQTALKYTYQDLLELLQRKDYEIYVYEMQEEIYGYLFANIQTTENSPIFYDEKVYYIDDLCIDENVRGKGIGKALYEFAKQRAKQLNCQRITLHAWTDNNKAVEFYEHLGMKAYRYSMEEKIN